MIVPAPEPYELPWWAWTLMIWFVVDMVMLMANHLRRKEKR